jgi:hypothetical protein
VLNALVVFTGSGLVGEVLRYVRSAALGWDDYVESIMGGMSRLLCFCTRY